MRAFKKLLCVFLAILFIAAPLSSGFTALAATGKYIVENLNGVNLYERANIQSSILAVIRKNTVLNLISTQGNFIKVKYDGYNGWVLLSSVSEYETPDSSISKISVTKLPDKTTYYEDEDLDETGLQITAYYNDGKTAVVKGTIYAPAMDSAGQKTVKLMYKGHYTDFKINVNRLPVDRIEITKQPDTKDVKEGMPLDLTGMELTVFYTDSRAAHTVDDYTVSGYDANKTGQQTLVISYRYDNVTTTLDINVIPKVLEKIEITTLPSKLDYYGEDRKISISGMVLMAYYDNGTSKKVTAESALCEDMKLGANTVTVTYQGKTAQYEINLHELEMIGFFISEPDRLNYLKGEEFNPSGLSIYYEYNSGERNYVTKDYTISKPDMNIIGIHSIEVSYKNNSASFNITVHGTNIFGDVDFNGKLAIKDARAILRAAVKIDIFSAEQKMACALAANQSETISIARKALRMSVGIEELKYLF